MPDGERRPALLVVSPDVGLDTTGGERIRKLTGAFDEQGWRLIGLAPPERDYLSSHARWPDSLVIRRSFDLNPWSLGVFVKRRLRGSELTPTPHGGQAPGGGSAPTAVEEMTTAALRRVWPYPWAGWVPFAVARGVTLARQERPAAILSSFPPTASHVVALALQRLTRLPWIADFRDPWASGAEHGYVWASRSRATARAEAAVLRRATALTTIGPSLGAELAERASRRVVVLPHGIPVESAGGASTSAPSDRLELVHAGSVDAWSADLAPVARALVRLHEAGTPVRLTLLGPIEHRPPDLDRAERLGLVRVTGKVSREEVQRRTAASDVALLVQKRPSKIWVTTKLWDYLASQTPILVAANPECDAAAIVRETKTGWTVPFDDEDGIVHVLAGADERRRDGDTLWEPDSDALRRYDSTAISRRFVELLNGLRP
jgi:hypothetical protein